MNLKRMTQIWKKFQREEEGGTKDWDESPKE
jgi:hypothetical protein